MPAFPVLALTCRCSLVNPCFNSEATAAQRAGELQRRVAGLEAELGRLREDHERQQNLFHHSLEAATAQVGLGRGGVCARAFGSVLFGCDLRSLDAATVQVGCGEGYRCTVYWAPWLCSPLAGGSCASGQGRP